MAQKTDFDDTRKEEPGRPKKQYEVLKRLHNAVIWGKPIEKRDYVWQGTIKLNKRVTIRIADQENNIGFVTIPANTKHKCGVVLLQQLILRAVNEGPSNMRYDYYAEGTPNTPNPLEIDVIEEEKNPDYPTTYETPRVPSL